jgi:transposase-like protein
VRVEWAGGAVREQTVRRSVQGYRRQRDWPQLSARLTALHEQNQTPRRSRSPSTEGFRPPKRVGTFTAGMVRRLLDGLGLRPRVSRCVASVGPLADGEWWLHELARHLVVSPHTLHGWRRKGWVHARQLGGRGGPWAVWAGGAELARMRELKACPRVWANRARLAQLRAPSPRG